MIIMSRTGKQYLLFCSTLLAVLLCGTRCAGETTPPTLDNDTTTLASAIESPTADACLQNITEEECCNTTGCIFFTCTTQPGCFVNSTTTVDQCSDNCTQSESTVSPISTTPTNTTASPVKTTTPSETTTTGETTSTPAGTTSSGETTSTASKLSTSSTQAGSTTPHTTAASKHGSSGQHFDSASFIGGIVLCAGLVAIAYFGCKFYKAKTDRNYHTL